MGQSEIDPVTQRAQARVGLVLRSKWRLDALLGVGGMAAVYAATHRNGKRGAVKMLHLELSMDADARKRFLREGYAANAVDHPGAVSVLDDDVAEDGSVFLVMELLEGETVEARAASRPGSKLEPGEVLAIVDQLLDTLVAAHQKGIVHRDIKPENMFLTKAGQVKVLDFGLARLHDLSRGSKGARMTATGNAMGTPAFMPPEQALGNWDTIDARTDIWAVGATMFTLLTGRFVHEADNVNKLLLAAMTKPSRKIATVEPSVPPVVAGIIDKALAFEQSDRWPDALTMRAAVRHSRAKESGDVVTLSEGLPAAPYRHLAAQLATQLNVEPAARSPLASSLGPTSSEPRLALGKKGVIAGGALFGILAGAILFLALRPSSEPATMGGPERSPQTPPATMGGPERSPQTPPATMGGPERSPQTPPATMGASQTPPVTTAEAAQPTPAEPARPVDSAVPSEPPAKPSATPSSTSNASPSTPPRTGTGPHTPATAHSTSKPSGGPKTPNTAKPADPMNKW